MVRNGGLLVDDCSTRAIFDEDIVGATGGESSESLESESMGAGPYERAGNPTDISAMTGDDGGSVGTERV